MKEVRESFGLLDRGSKLRVITVVIARLVSNLLDIAGLAMLALLAALLSSAGTQTEIEFGPINLEKTQDTIVFVSVIVFLAFLLKALVAVALLVYSSRLMAKIEAQSTLKIAEFMTAGGLRRVQGFSLGEMGWITGPAAQRSVSGLLYPFMNLVSEGSLVVMMFSALVWSDWQLALITTAYFAVFLAVFQISVSGTMRRIGRRMSAVSILVTNAIQDILGNFRELHVSGNMDRFLQKFHAPRTEQAYNQASQRVLIGIPRFVIEVVLMGGFLGLILFEFTNGDLRDAIPTLALFLAAGVKITGALLPIQKAFAEIRTVAPQAESALRILKLAKNAPTNAASQRHDPQSLTTNDNLTVSIKAVSFAYGHTKVLNDLDLAFPGGQFSALIGPSGGGKSTIIDLVAGLFPPDSGEVRIGEYHAVDFVTNFPGALRYVPQSPGILRGSVLENISLLTAEEADREKVEQLVARVELHDFVANLPDGLDSSLGKHSEAMSGGQRQRLGIARALYADPEILLLDEPTSALDATTEEKISLMLRNLGREMTLVVIAHRLSSIELADHVVAIDQGQKVGEGTLSTLVKDNEMVAALVASLSVEASRVS